MNLRIKTKNYAADSKIGIRLKIDLRADWTHESNPTAWGLMCSVNEKRLIFLTINYIVFSSIV